MSSSAHPPAHPTIPWLQIARLAWALLALAVVSVYVLGLAYQFSEPATLCLATSNVPCGEPESAAVMAQLGFPNWYIPFVVALHDVVVPLACLLVALLIYWRARESWLGLGTTVVLITYAVRLSTDVLDRLAVRAGGGLGWLVTFTVLDLLAISALVYLLFTFPVGRFARPWLAAVSALEVLLLLLASQNLLPSGLSSIVYFVCLVGGLAYQFYRYRRVCTPIERQQVKWVLVGLAGFIANALIWFLFVKAGVERGPAGIGALAFFAPFNALLALSLPIALGIAILRYRLRDIDVIVRRTLIYSALTATLALVYLASVLSLQGLLRLLTGQTQNQLVTVISTLAIAALFVPVRASVQHAIDRRFYRRKYDAARTLSDFSAAARDEVELARLADGLVSVVDQAMQPSQITLWLRPGTKL